jgi:hypothetical protein
LPIGIKTLSRMIDNSFSIDTSLRLEGRLISRYQATVYSENDFQRLSHIKLYDAEIHSAVVNEELIPLTIPDLFSSIKSLEAVISLEDPNIPSGYKFFEDLKEVRVYNATLFNQTNEDGVIFGEIVADVVGYIDYDSKLIGLSHEHNTSHTLVIKNSNSIVESSNKNKGIFQKFKQIIYALGLVLFLFASYLFINHYKSDVIDNPRASYIPMKSLYGQKYVTIFVNETSELFLLDTGASTTSVTSNFINNLVSDGYLDKQTHSRGYEMYTIADGSRVRGSIWMIPKIRVGNITLNNVEFVELEGSKTNLLGMSTLDLFGEYIINPNENLIEIK